MALLFSGCSDELPPEEKATIFAAAKHGDVALLSKRLDKGLDPDLYDDDHGYLIMEAVLWRKPEVVRLLIASGADVDASRSGKSTPLVSAVAISECESAKLLLAAGADADARFTDAWKAALGPEYQDKSVKELYLLIKRQLDKLPQPQQTCWLEFEKMMMK